MVTVFMLYISLSNGVCKAILSRLFRAGVDSPAISEFSPVFSTASVAIVRSIPTQLYAKTAEAQVAKAGALTSLLADD